MANMEAWSTGAVRMEVEGGHLPVVAAVELVRISALVHVIARADTEDPAFRAGFPIMMTTIEVYPLVSVARDPLAELGKRCADEFFASVVAHVKLVLEQPTPPTPRN